MAHDLEKKIKVLFIVRWYPDKADPQLGIFIKKHAQAVALYSDVAILCFSPFNPDFQDTDFYFSEEKNVKQFFLYYRKSSWPLFNVIKYLFLIMKGWKQVIKNFGKPDLLHAHVLARPWLIAYLWSVMYHLPFLITEHWTGFVNNRYLQKPAWYRWLTTYVAGKSSGITVVSQSMKKAMEKMGFKKNLTVIPNVVDFPEFENGMDQQKKIILTIADLLDEQKNISSTIQVIAKTALVRNDFEFHIIGGGPDQEWLKSLAEETGLLNKVIYFHGRKNNEEVYGWLGRAAFVVVNSNFETFSVVTAEALACGKPVIATICGGPEEIITSQTGILIQKGDSLSLEQAVNTMLDTHAKFNPELLRLSIKNRFSREIIGELFLKRYRELLAEGK